MTTLQELDDLRWEAYQLGITNPDIYPAEQLIALIKKKKTTNSNYKRGIWLNPRKMKNPTFRRIIGAQEAKKAILDSIVRPTQRPELYPLGWERCILLFGPPGTGKTLLAAETAREINAEFIEKDSASIQSKWIGEAAQNVAKLFNEARQALKLYKSKRPIIIFIDEVDALFGKPNRISDCNVEMRSQFLKEMDGVQDKGSNLYLYIIASTNKPWNLDGGFIRRFQKRIYVDLPDSGERIQLLRLYTKKLKLVPSFNFIPMSELCVGYSGSDIRDICRDANQVTLDRLFESNDPGSLPEPISKEDFETVIKRRSKSVSFDQVNEFEEWAQHNQAS